MTQHALDSSLPSMESVLDQLISATWKSPVKSGYEGEVQRVVAKLALQHLIVLSTDKDASSQARAVALLKTHEIKNWIAWQNPSNIYQKAHYHYCNVLLEGFESNPQETVSLLSPLAAPAGTPIGSTGQNWLEPVCSHDHGDGY